MGTGRSQIRPFANGETSAGTNDQYPPYRSVLEFCRRLARGLIFAFCGRAYF
jgi:hypothetical protein